MSLQRALESKSTVSNGVIKNEVIFVYTISKTRNNKL
jgi:hypothetical protein